MSDELGSLLNAVDNLCNILFVEPKLGVLYMFAFMASAIALNSMARDCKPSRSDKLMMVLISIGGIYNCTAFIITFVPWLCTFLTNQ